MEDAPKDDKIEGKFRMHLMPLDLLSELLCPAYEEGCIKYYENSWRLGFTITRMFSATVRHLVKFFFFGEDYDRESLAKYGIKKHHLGGALFSIICMYHTWKDYPEKDDRQIKNPLDFTE